jgi:hypothetical protein
MGLQTRFAIDTGATESILEREFVPSLGYELTTRRRKTLLTATSSKSSIIEIVAQRIEALGEVRINFPILCAAFQKGIEADGILGLDFFRGRRLTLDFRSGWIRFE